MIFKNSKIYDILKWFTMVGLPAITTLWLTLASIWQFPYAEPIGASLGAITVFLGAILGISSITYAKTNEEKKVLLENYTKEIKAELNKNDLEQDIYK